MSLNNYHAQYEYDSLIQSKKWLDKHGLEMADMHIKRIKELELILGIKKDLTAILVLNHNLILN